LFFILQMLTHNRILSAPVMTHLISSIDIVDILAHALTLQKSLKEKSFLGMILRNTTVGDVLEHSQVEPPSLLPDSVSCAEVFDELGSGKHRVLLVDKDGDIVRLISQVDCLKFARNLIHGNLQLQVRSCLFFSKWLCIAQI
jgi:CBS-domain-containing membrane protein